MSLQQLISQMAESGALNKATCRYLVDVTIITGTIKVAVKDSKNQMETVYSKVVNVVPFDLEAAADELRGVVAELHRYNELNKKSEDLAA